MISIVPRTGLLISLMTTAAVGATIQVSGPSAMPPVAGGEPLPSAPATNQSPAPAVAAVSPVASAALARWRSLRQASGLPFSSYASFLTSHRGWPGEASLRRAAERAIDPGSSSPFEVVSYFRVHPPLTATGHAGHAFALLALGRTDEAREAARRAWHGGTIAQNLESRLLASFPAALSPSDHDLRMEQLLAEGNPAGARQMMALASGARREAFALRLALQTNAPDAASRLALFGSAADTDPGIIIDRFNWLRKGGQTASARSLLAQPRTLANSPHSPRRWLEALLAAARGAAADGDWSTAYAIASRVNDTYPAGTVIADRPISERDDYTSLAWLGATTALDKLNRPADAAAMFVRYARGGRSGQVLTKGYYWAGRAAHAAGQAEQANNYFSEASVYPELFYGQLSLERLGRSVPAPAPVAEVEISDADRSAFQRLGLVEAVRLLGQLGQWEDQSVFVRALAEHAGTDRERALAAELAGQIGRRDLGVWLARSARNEGTPFYVRAGYPEVSIPAAQTNYWSLAHGIVRQESSFDPAAVSHAGARGMMQLMPGTAREVAGQLGLVHEQRRLTLDPAYNIMLGSHYFQSLMHYWGNNAALAAASYNAGSGNVLKWVRANGDPRLPGADIVRWIEDIPFSETRGYVQRVLENAVVYDAIRRSDASPQARAHISYYLGKSGRPG
ncbi:MAG: lytic transglycosylase domain-containing protein [Pseudomonadota bacterium]|nr:lytic transglycosylase domain-containing protein [Pseudomonadota bacterium]